jgi:hypothetical protein
MNRAKDLAEHIEAPQLVCNEFDVGAISGGECESAVKIVSYSETMSLGSVVVPDVDHDILAKGDIDDWPRTRTILATIETHVEACVRHYHGENGCVSWATRPD